MGAGGAATGSKRTGLAAIFPHGRFWRPLRAGSVAEVGQPVEQRPQLRRELTQLGEVRARQLLQSPLPRGSQLEAHQPVVTRVDAAADEPRGRGTVDESDDAVMPEEQRVGDVANRRSGRISGAADGEKQLMLGRGETRGGGLLLAPAQEAAQAGAELEESLVVLVGEGSRHETIVARG